MLYQKVTLSIFLFRHFLTQNLKLSYFLKNLAKVDLIIKRENEISITVV